MLLTFIDADSVFRHSNKRLNDIWKKSIRTKGITQTTASFNSMGTCSSFCNPSHGTSLRCVDSCRSARSTPYFKLSCLRCTETNMRVGRSTCC